MSFAVVNMLHIEHLAYYCLAGVFFHPTSILIRGYNVQIHTLISDSPRDPVSIQTNRVTRGYEHGSHMFRK